MADPTNDPTLGPAPSDAGDDLVTPAIPVLVLTSEAGSEVEAKVLEMGADDYLVKPFEPEVMLSRIRAAFRRAARTRS